LAYAHSPEQIETIPAVSSAHQERGFSRRMPRGTLGMVNPVGHQLIVESCSRSWHRGVIYLYTPPVSEGKKTSMLARDHVSCRESRPEDILLTAKAT